MNEYVYSPMKAAHTHTEREIKVYKIDRGQNYTQKHRQALNGIGNGNVLVSIGFVLVGQKIIIRGVDFRVGVLTSGEEQDNPQSPQLSQR